MREGEVAEADSLAADGVAGEGGDGVSRRGEALGKAKDGTVAACRTDVVAAGGERLTWGATAGSCNREPRRS